MKKATFASALACTWLVACSGGGGSGSSGTASPDRDDAAALFTDTLSVTAHTPADRAVQIAVDAVLTVTFDGVLAKECVAEPDTWLKRDGAGESIAMTVTFADGGRTLRFAPTAPLERATDYVLQLSPLTCDVDGRLLEETISFGFRTIDTTAPRLLATSVTANATGVPRSEPIVWTFDEELAAASITAATVYLRDVFGTRFAVASTLSGATLTVAPRVDLPGDRGFVMVVSGGNAGVQDRAGNLLASTVSLPFRTATDSTSPSLLTMWPDIAVGVSPQALIELTFDESMDAASVETAAVVFEDEFSNLVQYAVLPSSDARTLRLAPKFALIPGRNYAVRVAGGPGSVTDNSGNPLTTSREVRFKCGDDATPPRLFDASFAAEATRISPNARLELTLDGPLDPTRLGTARVRLERDGQAVPITLTTQDSARILGIVPAENLTASTRYTVRLVGGVDGIRDLAGNLAPTDITRSFTTTADATPPDLTIMPIQGSAAVSRDAVIAVFATEPLDPSSVTNSTIYLQDGVGTVLPGAVSLTGAGRVVRFAPTHELTPGASYRFTVLGGSDGLREASGNWSTGSISQQFRVTTGVDSNPPVVLASLNRTHPLRANGRTLPPFGFEIEVLALDADTYNQDITSTVVTIDGPSAGPSTEAIFAAAQLTPTSLVFRVPQSTALTPGDYTLRASVADLSGNVGESTTISFRVAVPDGRELPFERTQVVWVRFDLDRDGNGREDFYDDLLRLGLVTDGDPRGTNARMLQVVRDGILARAHELYARRANGGRIGLDSVAIRFSHRQPLGVPSMQIACGGFDPEGPRGRSYGDETSGTLGRAFYDYQNRQLNENNTAINPGVGVFPAELFLFEARIHSRVYPGFVTTFGSTFLPLAPAMGGTPVGSDPDDVAVTSTDFVYANASTSQRARYVTVFGAADEWATAIGTILSHEVGHSIGLVAPGRTSADLHGDQSLHNEFANISDVMGAAVGYDGLVTLDYAFRDVNLAYLRHRMLLK